MRATVISDGYGNVPFWPIFAANQPASATEAFLKENRLGPAPQFTNNLLVVDTPADRVLVDTGFGDVLGPSSGQFPWMVQNLERAGIPAESITMVIITHIHLDHVAGIVTKSGEHVFPKARYVVVDDELTYWTGNRFEADVNASKARKSPRRRQFSLPRLTCRLFGSGCRLCAQAQRWLQALLLFPLPVIQRPTQPSASALAMRSSFIWPMWLIAQIRDCNTRSGPSFSILTASRQSQRENGSLPRSRPTAPS
jgi:hypothetical protein